MAKLIVCRLIRFLILIGFRRKAHYNEFHAVKLAKELLAQEEEEEEEVNAKMLGNWIEMTNIWKDEFLIILLILFFRFFPAPSLISSSYVHILFRLLLAYPFILFILYPLLVLPFSLLLQEAESQ